jgi:hypothetical protein
LIASLKSKWRENFRMEANTCRRAPGRHPGPLYCLIYLIQRKYYNSQETLQHPHPITTLIFTYLIMSVKKNRNIKVVIYFSSSVTS